MQDDGKASGLIDNQKPQKAKIWFSPQETADELGLKVGTIYNWISAKEIEVHRPGPEKRKRRRVKIHVSVVERLKGNKIS